MQRKEWLKVDAITGKPLPFDVETTRLHLLGFFMPEGGVFPGPVEMMVAHNGVHYRVDHRGYLRALDPRVDYTPDIPAVAGATLEVGAGAYAVSAGSILIGRESLRRHHLRSALAGNTLSPAVAQKINEHLADLPRRTLLERAFARGGLDEHKAIQTFLQLGGRISACKGTAEDHAQRGGQPAYLRPARSGVLAY